VWAVLTFAGMGFVLAFTRNMPWADEWEFVPALTGNEPIPEWLWKQHNEHRLPLPRLLYLLLFRLTGDFRAGCVLQILMLSALAWWLMRVSAKVRGESAWEDAFIPAGLLNWGHVENFLMGYQINFVLVCGLACGLLVTAFASTNANRFRTGVTAGVLLLLLELCGGTGLAFVPTVGLWLLVLAASALRCASRLHGLIGVGLVTVAGGYIWLYFQGYERPPGHPPMNLEHPRKAMLVTSQYLAMGLGYGVKPAWPLASAFVVALLGGTVFHLGNVWRTDRESRLRVEGILAVLGGVVALAVAVGLGRSGFNSDEMGLWSRYGLLAWPVLFAGFLAFSRTRRWVQTALCGVTLALLPMNFAAGWGWAESHDRWLGSIETAVLAGVPAEEIVAEWLKQPGQEERALRGMPMLRDANIGVFPHLKDAP
jgi:hypothetical protein